MTGEPIGWHSLTAAALLDAVYVTFALALYATTLRHARVKRRLARFRE
jgi:hypothetical protein